MQHWPLLVCGEALRRRGRQMVALQRLTQETGGTQRIRHILDFSWTRQSVFAFFCKGAAPSWCLKCFELDA